jgi:hypothetical protein
MTNLFEEDPELEAKVEKRLKENRSSLPYKSKNSMRNLKQYAKMSEDEYDSMVEKEVLDIQPDKLWLSLIEKKMKEYEGSYDLADLKINDIDSLRALAAASVRLDAFDAILNKEIARGVTPDNILVIEKIGKYMSDLRGDMSKLQEDLKITRKNRKGDKEVSVINYLEDLKLKARTFYEKKSFQIFCPKCNTLIANWWTLYPESKNKIVLTCTRQSGDEGTICGETISLSSKELMEMGGNNKTDIPAAML